MDLFNPNDEVLMLRNMIKEFVSAEVEPQAQEFDRKEEFNLSLFRKLGDLGLLGITVSEEDGGSGMSSLAAVIAHEELSASDPGFCLAYLAHAMLCVNNLAVNGSSAQKEKYLPKLLSGEWVGCMAMSEPHVGTDVMGMKTTAKKQGDDYIINGQKMWITNGVIDEKGTPGYKVGQKIQDKSGMRGSNTAELVFENCKVPKENLVGKEGDSLIHMMKNLEIERLTLAAMSLGIARRCMEEMVKYSNEREAFGKPIKKFGQIQKYIGESYAQYMAAKSYVYNTAMKLDSNEPNTRVDSDGVKLFASTMGKVVADNAIQVLGGYGYVGEYNVERFWRDAKLLEIGGGTIEAHQKNICNDLTRNPKLI